MSIAMRQGIGSVIGQHRRGSLLENLEWEDSSDDGEEERRAIIAKANLLDVVGRGSDDEDKKFENELKEAKYNQGLDTMTVSAHPTFAACPPKGPRNFVQQLGCGILCWSSLGCLGKLNVSPRLVPVDMS
jgi:hypothetical protein